MPPLQTYSTTKKGVRDLIISLILGIVLTFIIIKATQVQIDLPLSNYYSSFSFLKAYGKNVVNVIIVDFRGLDTLGEITVLLLVALGIPTMLKKKKEDKH
jgi:multicomponent Na+:H+ antiporter subunit A